MHLPRHYHTEPSGTLYSVLCSPFASNSIHPLNSSQRSILFLPRMSYNWKHGTDSLLNLTFFIKKLISHSSVLMPWANSSSYCRILFYCMAMPDWFSGFVCLFSRWDVSKSKKNVTGLRCSSAVERLPSIHENLWLGPASQTRKRRGRERKGKGQDYKKSVGKLF